MKDNTVTAIFIVAMTSANAAEWQFAVDTGVKKHGKAFLWIPPECNYVRGLIVGQQVILERPALEDPQIRAAAAREDLGILFIVPGAIGYDEFGPKGGGERKYNEIVAKLAEVSGYSEVVHAPFLGIGHSGGAIPVWRMAYWKPGRCFGVIGLHAAPIGPPAHDQKARAEGVPILVITGQYESWGSPVRSIEHHWRWCRGDILAMRSRWDRALMSVLVQPGAGHFNWDDDLAKYVAMFIEKAANRRIPKRSAAGRKPKLRDLPLESGWLTGNTLITPARYPASAYRDYRGDPLMAFWHLDEDLARANVAYGTKDHGKNLQMVTFVEDGKPVKPGWIESLKFKPTGDGMTMKVQADFVKETPAEFAVDGGMRKLGHADGPIKFRLIGGWCGGGEQVGPDTFRIKCDRFMLARRREGSLMVMAYHPGDMEFGHAEQPCSIKFPEMNKRGKAQKITFSSIPGQKIGAADIELKAVSDSGMPVEYCVIAGPAKLKGNKLSLTRIPPRTRFPVKVSVVAYQWGRSIEPLVQSAEYVEHTFNIVE